MKLEHEDITGAIIGSAYEVHNILGYGFLEKVIRKHYRWNYYAVVILLK